MQKCSGHSCLPPGGCRNGPPSLPVRDVVFWWHTACLGLTSPFFPPWDSCAHSCLGALPLGSIWQGPQSLCLLCGLCLSLLLLNTLPCTLSPRPPRLPRPRVPPQSLSLHLVLDVPASAHDPQKSSLVAASGHLSRLVFAACEVPSTEPGRLVASRTPRAED